MKPSPKVGRQMGKIVNQAVKARNEAKGRPFIVSHFITNRCMCKCKSCLWLHNDWEDVPAEDVKRFYKEASEAGFVGAAFSGGEPFLRKDLGEIVKFVDEVADIPLMLFTTGWFLEERMDEILPHVTMLMLSLDSAKAEKHDEIRGLKGLFDRLMKSSDLARQKYPDLSIQFNACVQKGIEDEIDDMIALTEKKGFKISFDVISEYRHGEGDTHFTETNEGLPLPELRGICKYLQERKAEGAPILNSEQYFNYFIEGKPAYKCHFPKVAICIDGRGAVEDCLNLDKPIANIKDMSVKDIMELPRFKQLRKDSEDCSSCNSPTMIDLSNMWEDPQIIFQRGGISLG